MNRFYYISFFFILLYSCSPAKIASEYKEQSAALLNTPITKEIGESLIDNETGFFLPAIVASESMDAGEGMYKTQVKKGELFLHKEFTSEYDFYYSVDNPKNGIALAKDSRNDGVMVSDGMGGYRIYDVKERIKYTKNTYHDTSKDYYKQQFIYNGKSGSTLKFTYREFINDLARAAFTQELQYDTNESSTIGMKGLRLEVLKTTNTNIEYKILSNFTSK